MFFAPCWIISTFAPGRDESTFVCVFSREGTYDDDIDVRFVLKNVKELCLDPLFFLGVVSVHVDFDFFPEAFIILPDFLDATHSKQMSSCFL